MQVELKLISVCPTFLKYGLDVVQATKKSEVQVESFDIFFFFL
jgi:hypothetical protein